MKLQNFQTEYRGVTRIPTTFKTQIFATLVHGQKPLNNVTKSTIPGIVRVLEGHISLEYNKQTQIVPKTTEKTVKNLT